MHPLLGLPGAVGSSAAETWAARAVWGTAPVWQESCPVLLCRGTSVVQTEVCLINLNCLLLCWVRQLVWVLDQSHLFGPFWSLMFSRVKPCFVSEGKITVVMTSVHCGGFIVTVNVVASFLVETSFTSNNNVNDLVLLAVCCSTFCSAT